MSLLKGEGAVFAFLHGSLFLSSGELQRVLARLAPHAPEMCRFSVRIRGWKYQGGVTSFELCALSLVWSGIDSANEGCAVHSWCLGPWAVCAAACRCWGSGTGSVCAEMWPVTPRQCPSSTDPCSFGELPGS